MNLSFAGCGFLGIYHVGVACCFRKYTPHLLLNKISGASAGAVAACCLICDLPLGEFTSDILRVSTEARSRSLGPFTPSFNVHQLLLEGLERVLPDDAHKRVSGKLHISLTRVHDGKNVIVSEFDSRDELIQALLASAFIPFFSGLIPPKFRGVRYMDGGYSDNLPTLDENTITVSPFCGESDICPRDDSAQLFHINIANTSIELSSHNIYRMIRIFFPPKPEVLSNMCKQGFDDALRFLHRNNLISCTRCLAVQSTFVVSSNSLDDNYEYDPQCHECKLHRQEALVSNMPETVLNVFQEVIDSANKGLLNWIFKHRGMKLLSVLSLPYTLPVDIMYATFMKFKVIATVGFGPIVIYRKLTDCNFINVIGKHFESQTIRYIPLSPIIVASSTCYACNNLGTFRAIRLMAAKPSLGNCISEVSQYFIEHLTYFLQRINKKSQQLSAKITCHLAFTEYNKGNIQICKEDVVSTRNKMNLNFMVNIENSGTSQNERRASLLSTTDQLQRVPSLTILNANTDDDDFDNILQVTSHHETLMAYYYLDDDNKLKVTEIYDVTDSESPVVQSSSEREANFNLEFDESWNEFTLNERNSSEESDSSDEPAEADSTNIFSDPESEWVETTKDKSTTLDTNFVNDEDDLNNKPESEQATDTMDLPTHNVVPPMTFTDP